MKKDLTKNTPAQLQALLSEKSKAFRDFSLNLSKVKTKNVKEGKNLKKEIARILTLVNAPKKA
jgi:ribosomal protein L29